MTITSASRLEIYGNGKTGRSDTRSWIAWADMRSGPNKSATYISPNVICNLNEIDQPNVPHWKVLKFVQ